MKYVHYSNFSAFWRDYGCGREVLTVYSMRVDTVPAFVFDLEAVMRSWNFAESYQYLCISNEEAHKTKPITCLQDTKSVISVVLGISNSIL